jgi:hypothetical protein
MRPIRRKEQYKVVVDPLTGQERPSEGYYENDILSDEGSVDTFGKHKDFFKDCGCLGPAGGRCHDCHALSCVSCHGRCGVCAKPICLQCSVFADVAGGGKVRLCRRCHLRIVRRERQRKVVRFLLSPFVRFGD